MAADPLLTVCIITYNHADSIERAVNSALAQVTDFDVEIVIADDCSTDGTTDLLQELKRRNPDRITLLLRSSNVGPARNWLELLQFPTSRYIAYLEGDDSWSGELKLQKQVDALEADSKCSLCFHDALVRGPDGEESVFPGGTKSTFNTFDVIVRSWFCPSGSVVFRSEIVEYIPNDIDHIPNGDILLLFLASTRGHLLRVDECLSVYNFMSAGSRTSSLSDDDGAFKKYKNITNTLSAINEISGGKYRLFVLIKKLRIKLSVLRLQMLRAFRTSKKASGQVSN